MFVGVHDPISQAGSRSPMVTLSPTLGLEGRNSQHWEEGEAQAQKSSYLAVRGPECDPCHRLHHLTSPSTISPDLLTSSMAERDLGPLTTKTQKNKGQAKNVCALRDTRELRHLKAVRGARIGRAGGMVGAGSGGRRVKAEV